MPHSLTIRIGLPSAIVIQYCIESGNKMLETLRHDIEKHDLKRLQR